VQALCGYGIVLRYKIDQAVHILPVRRLLQIVEQRLKNGGKAGNAMH
jgi:hypothetical protein